MKEIVFAIPSYRRADRQLAARWLSRLGYRPSEIFVAVQNDEDRAAYTDALRGVATVFGQNGVGVSFNRNQCLSVRPDARLVMVDDGVHGVSVKTPQGKCESVKTRERLDAMLSLMFDFAERNRVNVFSLNPSSNGLCASSKDFINHLLVNTFMGIVDRRTLFNASMSCNEDTERNARIVKGGGRTYRFSYAFPHVTHGLTGGQHANHKKEVQERAKAIVARWFPDFISLSRNRSGEVALVFNRDRYKVRKAGVLFGKI